MTSKYLRSVVPLATALILGGSCARQTQTLAEAPIDLLEAAVRALQSNGSGVHVSAYCLGYQDYDLNQRDWIYADAPRRLLERFAQDTVPVRPASACIWQAQGDYLPAWVIDTVSGEHAMMLWLTDPPSWKGDTLVINGDYHCGSLCGGAGPIRLWRRGSKWHASFDVQLVS